MTATAKSLHCTVRQTQDYAVGLLLRWSGSKPAAASKLLVEAVNGVIVALGSYSTPVCVELCAAAFGLMQTNPSLLSVLAARANIRV